MNQRTLFVYYKINQSEIHERLQQAQQLQRRMLQQWPGLSCELMRRPPKPAEPQNTWMEIYRHANGLTDEMIECISEAANELNMPLPRMSELFVKLEQADIASQ